ncbi:hypothetical protein JCM8547_006380 [Rhodosporidiobolus lusitaniae]
MPSSSPSSLPGRRFSASTDPRRTPVMSSPLATSAPFTHTAIDSILEASPAVSPTPSSTDSFESSNHLTGGKAGEVTPFGAPRGTVIPRSPNLGSNLQRGASSGIAPKLSPNLTSLPFFGASDGASSMLMQRTPSTGAGRDEHGSKPAGAGHLRRRSSSSNLYSSLLLGDEASKSVSTGMERAASLTTFMKSGGGKGREKGRDSVHSGVGTPRIHRRRLYTSFTRLLGLVTLTLLSLYLVKKAVFSVFSPSSDTPKPETTSSAWLPAGLKSGKLLFDTLETVPYPAKTHPRTPPRDQTSTLTLAEYLTTRLGSHFSFPSANLPGRSTPGSQLWLTTALNRSVAVSAAHLVAFARNLETASSPLAAFAQADYFNLHNESSSSASTTAPLENRDQHSAQRTVVVMCRDEGCMEYCRKDPDLYCFGGFMAGQHNRPGQEVDHLKALGGENGHEVAKLRAIVETLESGRRVFWADDGVYFKEDPVPYMGDLTSYDLQIPDTWSSGHLNTGFFFVNPTQRTISLLHKLYDLSTLSSAQDRATWASTNFLLDPSGQQRNSHRAAPTHSEELDENLFEDDVEAAAEGKNEYGQIEFESPWEGGLDVRVLDPKRFKTSEGRLGRRTFDFEKARGNAKLYWWCTCCGDEYSNNYIAGALGFHQPSVTYNLPQITDIPSLPLVLKSPALRGTPDQLHYGMGLLLQLAYESGRTFVPPLTVNVLEENAGRTRETEKYVFRTFPISRWAHPTAPTTSTIALGDLPHDMKVSEPGYVQHAEQHLKSQFPNQLEASKLVKELEEPLVLDVRKLISLKDMVHGLTRPFWSTERIVVVEGVEDVMGKEGWELKSEFRTVAMCKSGEHKEKKGTCTQLCPL